MGNLSSPEHLVGHLSRPQTLSGHIERGASQTTIDKLTKAVKKNLADENLLVTEEDRNAWDAKATTEQTKEALENEDLLVSSEDRNAWDAKATTEQTKEALKNEDLLVSSEDRAFWDLGRLICYVNPENPKNLVFALREKE